MSNCEKCLLNMWPLSFSMPCHMLEKGDLPFVRVYLQPPFYIKMHLTKYGYNEFGPMVPWASLYTKLTVLKMLDVYFCANKTFHWLLTLMGAFWVKEPFWILLPLDNSISKKLVLCSWFLCPLKGPPRASSNRTVRLFVCPSVSLSVIPSGLQTKCNI